MTPALFWLRFALPGFGVVLAKICVAWPQAYFDSYLRCLVSGLCWLRCALPTFEMIWVIFALHGFGVVLDKMCAAWLRACSGYNWGCLVSGLFWLRFALPVSVKPDFPFAIS